MSRNRSVVKVLVTGRLTLLVDIQRSYKVCCLMAFFITFFYVLLVTFLLF
jgi:hypothetical protein